MGARITYDSKNIDFPAADDITLLQPSRNQEREENESASGKMEFINFYAVDDIELRIDDLSTDSFKDSLDAFWSWARQGKEFAFAYDTADMINTTLDGAAVSGQKIIPLTSTSGIVAGQKYLIRAIATGYEEIVEIDTINAGVSVVTVENLKFTYASGDLFRSRFYWPSLVCLDTKYPIDWKIINFDFKLKMREKL